MYLKVLNKKKTISDQRRALWDFIKKFGSNLIDGKDLVNTTLPVYIFQPKSFLERISDCWVYIQFLNKAKEAKDPVERFLFCMAFGIGGLHQQTEGKKTF